MQQDTDNAGRFHRDGDRGVQLLPLAALLQIPRLQRMEEVIGRSHQRHRALDPPVGRVNEHVPD